MPSQANIDQLKSYKTILEDPKHKTIDTTKLPEADLIASLQCLATAVEPKLINKILTDHAAVASQWSINALSYYNPKDKAYLIALIEEKIANEQSILQANKDSKVLLKGAADRRDEQVTRLGEEGLRSEAQINKNRTIGLQFVISAAVILGFIALSGLMGSPALVIGAIAGVAAVASIGVELTRSIMKQRIDETNNAKCNEARSTYNTAVATIETKKLEDISALELAHQDKVNKINAAYLAEKPPAQTSMVSNIYSNIYNFYNNALATIAISPEEDVNFENYTYEF